MRKHYREVWAEEDKKLRQKLEAVKRTSTYRRLFDHYLDQYLNRVYGADADLLPLRADPEVRRKFASEIEGHLLAVECQIPTAVDPDAETPEVSDPAMPIRTVPYPNPGKRVPYRDRILKDCRFAMVEVDLTFPRERLRAEFDFLLAFIWPLAERKGREARGPGLEELAFKVYDLHQAGTSLYKITQQIYGREIRAHPGGASPSQNPEIRKFFARITRAFHKAETLIEQEERRLQEVTR
jgi:hypothetical protein